MPRWAVVEAHGQAESSWYRIHSELEGTEAEALSAMLRIVDSFKKAYSVKGIQRQKRQVFRVSERSYYVRVEDRWSSAEEAHFTLAELIADIHDDDLPDTAGEPAEES
ncbi:hypothetical protein ACH4S8_30710 [Streptomyces sp. NPDC021080]|uniref:hypothetical protein n=1 Tax=Streptomyces sp. NPDC021080 TaxID=3365110 RepID=UPI0037BA8DFD